MYEDITYEKILRRMLERVPDTVDKREGSVIYDAMAPAAVEMQLMYIELENTLNQTFADTADREYLIKRGAERGLAPYEATNAVCRGVFNTDIPQDARFSLESLNYKAVEKLSEGIYKMVCETKGSIGNSFLGDLTPIDYIDGLTEAKLVEILIPGEDEEDTEAFRKRYFESLSAQAYGGNVADYKSKIKEIPGVGALKVFPVWNGGGTVKIVFLNSRYDVPSVELLEEIQKQIDPPESQGMGLGIAPIGHRVTVEAAGREVINIHTSITYEAGWSFEEAKTQIIDTMDEYLRELCREWEETEHIIVRVSQIESRLLNVKGILDISDTQINGMKANFVADSVKIPVRGDFIG